MKHSAAKVSEKGVGENLFKDFLPQIKNSSEEVWRNRSYKNGSSKKLFLAIFSALRTVAVAAVSGGFVFSVPDPRADGGQRDENKHDDIGGAHAIRLPTV